MATKAESFAKLQDILQNAWVDINKYNAALASWASSEEALKAGWYTWQKAQTTSQATYDASQQKSNQIIQQKQDISNQLNSMSQTAAQANSRNSQVGTWDVAEMPQQQTQQLVSQARADRLTKSWNNLTAEQQQERLNRTAWLAEALAKKWLTVKPTTTTQPATTTQPTIQKTTQPQTPKQEQWDYQDNSQARMDQIANNLNGYRQTMPQLFDDMSAFYNFFIKDKGRSQDQIDFLWDYYDRVQKYGKYDNMSPEQLWTWIANGTIPEDYLNTLKSTDPQKYQEVMAAKQNREDTIKNESFLNDAATMAWMEWWESEPSSIQYAKRNQTWMDEDNNWVDDRREHYASEEEQWYQKQIADLNAANLDIDNTVKHTYDDLVKKYPWATKATLMAMAQDINSDLLREKENNLVELTRLQGYVWYMQQERFEMNQAGADSIAQLQKNLWMYYQYSPEWIAELAQAQYWATNITLDQADSWNETQKQMALQNVLDWYYQKYWDIIQRSEQQVINDVIAYAKKNWVWLAEALQENFVKRLQQKPQFATLSSWWTLWWAWTDKWDTVKITWADWKEKTVLYNQATWDVKNVDWTAYDWAIKTTAVWWATFKPVSKSAQTQALASVQSEYWTWSTYKNWWCWELANLYLQRMWSDIHLWDKIGDKTKYITTKVWEWLPNVWDLVVRDFSSNPKASKVSQESWHVAVVTDVYEDWSFDVYQQNWDWKHTVWTAHIPNTNYVAWYIDPTAVSGWTWWAWDYSSANYMDYETWVLNFIPIQLRNTEKEQEKIVTKIKSYYDRWLWQTEAALVQMWFNVQKATPEGKNVANRIVDMLSYVADEDAFDTTFMTMVSNDVNNWKYSEALKKTENMVYKYIQQSWQNAVSKTDIADTAVALSSLNKYKNNWNWLNNATLTLENIISAWGKKVEQFNVRQANLINTLEWLWYSEEMAQQLVPNLTMSRSAFVWKMDALQNLILDRYNRQRWEYWMPPVNLAVLLWNQSLSTAYWVNSEWEALQVF